MKHHPTPETLERLLASSCKADLTFSRTGRLLFSTDASVFQVVPMGVVAPKTVDDLARVLRICAEQDVSVHARGGGTGLAGESLGPGIVLDTHRHLRDILDFDPEGRLVRCRPGATLGTLDALAARHGLKIGPDPSSASRATAGGTLGTNATGAHSLAYGYMGDAVQALTFLTMQGETVTLSQDGTIHVSASFLNTVLPSLKELATHHTDDITKAYPRQHRNRSGYDLRRLTQADARSLIALLAGSEGTLGVFTEITLSLVPRPRHTGLVLYGFHRVEDAGRAVPEILAHAPYSLELIGERVARMGIAHLPAVRSLLGEHPLTLLLGEWKADSEEELNERLERAERILAAESLALLRRAAAPAEMERLWLIRKEAEALLMNEVPGKRAISFVEDIAVPHERLAELIRVKERLFAKHKLDWATYGHAGPGELHTKAYVDLADRNELSRLVELAKDLYAEVWAMGGTMSGEHGDGLSRGPFLSGQYPTLAPVFAAVKRLFDPQGLLNPGKKTDIPAGEHPLLTHSRYLDRPLRVSAPRLLHWPHGEWERQATACHGCGACRVEQIQPTMCPVFKATKDELTSPRSKGNLARLWLQGLIGQDGVLEAEALFVADACIHCQACVRECPSHVDIPALMTEFKAWRVKADAAPWTDRLLAQSEHGAKAAAWMAPVSNALASLSPLRHAAQTLGGISARAALPHFQRGSLSEKINGLSTNRGLQSVVYFTDYAVAHGDHELGLLAVRLLNHHGYRVLPYTVLGSQMPAITTGHLDVARKNIRQACRELMVLSPDSLILCTEPTAALALRDEWPRVADEPEVRAVASRVVEMGAWLAEFHRQGCLDTGFRETPLRLAHHLPCHLAALGGESPYLPLLDLIPGLHVRRIRQGCCGMAGTYGMKERHRALSEAMARPLWDAYLQDDAEGLTECATCALRMMEGKPGVGVWHPIRVLALAYGMEP